MEHEICIFSCRSGRSFALKTVAALSKIAASNNKVKMGKVKLSEITTKIFRDGEIYQRLEEKVRGKDVFVFQSLLSPGSLNIHENIMELLLLNGVIKLSSAHRITNIIPYHVYARQDRKSKGREGISAKQVARLLEASGADRILTVDLHAGQIQGFYDIPVDNLTSLPVLAAHAKKQYKAASGALVVVSPDAGGVWRAQKFAELIGASLAIINKHRPRQGEAESIGLVGDVKGKDVIIVDDMIDSGGTLEQAVAELRKKGAGNIAAYCCHPLLSNPATERLGRLGIRVVGTDTVTHEPSYLKSNAWFTQLSVAPQFAEAIFNIHTNRSVSRILDELAQMQ